jgi:hypothetical protein
MYGGFTYTKDTHEANIGPIELSVKDKQTVNIPVWAGMGPIAIGGGTSSCWWLEAITVSNKTFPNSAKRYRSAVEDMRVYEEGVS